MGGRHLLEAMRTNSVIRSIALVSIDPMFFANDNSPAMQMKTSVHEDLRRQITQLAQRNSNSVYIYGQVDVKFDCDKMSFTYMLRKNERSRLSDYGDDIFYDLFDALIQKKFTRVKTIEIVSFEFIVCTTVITNNAVGAATSRIV